MNNTVQCPVCTLYLRAGITLKDHLDTHPKDKVIEALVSSSEQKLAAAVVNQQPSFQNTFIQQQPFQINNHVANPMQFSIIQPNTDQMQAAQSVFVPNIISNRRYIVSQPGTLIKVPQRNPEKVFTALPAPFCNQLIGTTNYASPQLQIPARNPQPHILSSNTQTINTQGGPAIIYSQLPPPVQSVPNVQQHGHFQGVQQNFQVTSQPQTPVVVPTSSSISTPISSSSSFCNSSLQPFNTTITPVQSTKTPTSEISQKNTPIVLEVSNTQEYCNASTQVSSVAISNNENLDEQYVKKLYQEVKDDLDDNDQYSEYFETNEIYMTDAQFSGSNDETISELKEEPEEFMEDDKSSIEFSTEHETNAVVHSEPNKESECFEMDKHPSSANKYKEQESAMTSVDNMILGDESRVHVGFNSNVIDEIEYNEDASSEINGDTDERQDEELFETLIDIDESDVTVENVINKVQEREIDLSKSSINKVTANSNEIRAMSNNIQNASISFQPIESRNVSVSKQPIDHTNNVITSMSGVKATTNWSSTDQGNKMSMDSADYSNKTSFSLPSIDHNRMKVGIETYDHTNKFNTGIQPIDLHNKIKSNANSTGKNQINSTVSENHNKLNVTVLSRENNKVNILPVKYNSQENICELPNYKAKMLNRSVVIEPVDVQHGKEAVPTKNKVSITNVTCSNQKEIPEPSKKLNMNNKRTMIEDNRTPLDSLSPCVEVPQEKKQKQDITTNSIDVELISVRHGLWSFPITGDQNYKVQGVMYNLKAFGNTFLGVHKLEIPSIKTETTDDVKVKCEKNSVSTVCIPSSSSTPDVTVHLIPKIKTESDHTSMIMNRVPKVEDPTHVLPSSPNPPPYNATQNHRGKKPVRILQIKNAKKKEPVETQNSPFSSACTSSVIQHPVKTEPPPPYDSKHGILPCQPSSSKSVTISPVSRTSHLIASDMPSVSSISQSQPPTVEITPSKFFSSALPSPRLHSPSLQDFTDLVNNTKLDRLTNLHHTEYDSVDTPHWLLRGINILPQVIEDDRISCASPKTLLNLDHQTSFQTFEPEDSGSTSINMQTDEMMPPRGELSGQESLESSVWGYQEDHVATQYRQWDDMEPEVENVSNCNNFRTKIEKVEPMELLTEKIKLEEPISIIPVPSLSNVEIVTKKKHACIYCNKTFTGWKLRKYHMKTEHAELFNEPEPGKLLSKVQTSTSIVLSEPSTSFISQATCPIKFENSNSFSTEFLPPSVSSANSKQRQCESCSEVFDKLKPYQDHIRNVHPLACPLCNKTFLAKSNLTLHMRTHLKIKPYKCDVCEKSFVTAQKLSDHKNTHTGNAPFPCNMCDRHFKRYSNLAQHKKVIHLKKKKTKDFYCHCGEIFQSRGKLLWHQETHANIPKQCTFCSEKFTHTSSLTRHIRKNHDPCYLPLDRKKTDENVSCDICKIVVLKSTLKSHMRIHDTAKPFACTVCKKSFYTKWNLGLHQWTHVSRTHMPFKCKSCNRGFYSGNEYQAHLRSHRNIRPYTCNYCGRKFIRKFNCIRHVREHEAKKKYNCTVCGKTFHRSYYLTAHVRVHNGERPFSCHICGKTSTTKSNHNKHVKTHHARETVNTEG